MAEQKYYSRNETAEIRGLHPRTIQRYLLSGKLKGARLGKAWKISDDDIKAFYEAVKKETAKIIKERNKDT
jgi:excisionase family DNA binding protein